MEWRWCLPSYWYSLSFQHLYTWDSFYGQQKKVKISPTGDLMAYLEKKKKRGKCETVYKRAGNHSNLHLKYFTVTLLSIRLAQRFKERRESNKAALKQPCLCGERIFTLTLRSPFFFPNTKGGGRAELRAFNGVMLPSNGHSFTERRRRFSEDVLSAAQSLLLDPE